MLRTDLFKTVNRTETRFIAVRDTITLPCPTIDAKFIDVKHCRQGRLGIGYHFLLLVSGTIQLGRDIETIGSHSRDLDGLSVSIGIVGGKDEGKERVNTRNQDQQEALQDLIQFLQERYPDAEVSDRPQGDYP
jgi:hypothetical protein